jgi:hypothetical protein
MSDDKRLLRIIGEEVRRTSTGRADRSVVERRCGEGFEDALLALTNRNCIRKLGPADTISLSPAGEGELDGVGRAAPF